MAATDRALERACTALWSATLALMTAYMGTAAPAHRLLLARRITANFQTLAAQECFAPPSREAFARLHLRWHATAVGLARPVPPGGETGLFERLLSARL